MCRTSCTFRQAAACRFAWRCTCQCCMQRRGCRRRRFRCRLFSRRTGTAQHWWTQADLLQRGRMGRGCTQTVPAGAGTFLRHTHSQINDNIACTSTIARAAQRENAPGAHASHEYSSGLVAADLSAANLPSSHTLHAPSSDVCPSLAPLMPTVPAGHAVQAVAPSTAWYVPCWQARHCGCPAAG